MTTKPPRRMAHLRWLLLPLLLGGAMLLFAALDSPIAAGQDDEEPPALGQLVCLVKRLGANASETDPTGFQFTVTQGNQQMGIPITTTQPPECVHVDEFDVPDAEGDAYGAAFYITPGAQFTIHESSSDPLVGLVQDPSLTFCAQEIEGLSGLTTTMTSDSITAQSLVDFEDRTIWCFLTNDSVLICVTKTNSDNADDLTPAVDEIDAEFTVKIGDDGTPQTFNPQAQGSEEAPCGLLSNTFAVFAPPNTPITIEETDTGHPALGLSNGNCGEAAADDNGKITFTTPNAATTINCSYNNLTVPVCVEKQLGYGVPDDVMPGDFSFVVFVNDNELDPAPVLSLGGCESNGQIDDVMPGEVGHFTFYVAPGTSFTVTENESMDKRVGLSDFDCYQGESRIGEAERRTVYVNGPYEPEPIDCYFYNDSVLVCVAKSIGENAEAAGVKASEFTFQLLVGGEPVDEAVPVSPGGDEMLPCESREISDTSSVAVLHVAPNTLFDVRELIPDGSPAGLVVGECSYYKNIGDGFYDYHFAAIDFDTAPDSTTVSFSETDIDPRLFEADSGPVECLFINDSVKVTVNKVVINNSGGTGTVADFTLEVFDGSGASLGSGVDPDGDSETGLVVYAAPRSSITVAEIQAEGYTLVPGSPTCVAVDDDRVPVQALSSTVGTYTIESGVSEVVCTVTNDDIDLIPVCGVQLLTPGDTGFTLADFTLELYQSGSLVAPGRNAADPADNPCAQNLAGATPAGQLAGNSLLLGSVPFNGGTYTFVSVKPADPQDRLQLDSISCSIANVTQPASAAQATFTPNATTQVVRCTAVHSPKPPVFTPGGDFVRPVPEPPAAVPVVAPPVPQQVIAVTATPPLAVTGRSLAPIPFALTIIGLGSATLGTASHNRRRHRN